MKGPQRYPGKVLSNVFLLILAFASTALLITEDGSLAGPIPSGGAIWRVIDSPNVDGSPNLLMATTASSSNDVWAVGIYNASPQGGRVQTQRWTGNGWNLVSSPNVSASPYGLYAADSLAGNDVWGIGSYYSGGNQYTLAEHWNGSSWQVVSSPNAGTGNGLNGVDARASDDVWAVGGYIGNGATTDQTLILHWNGQQWSISPSPNAAGFNFLLGVSAIASNDVWAVGFYAPDNQIGHARTLTLHWNGQNWTIVPSPNPPNAIGSQLASVSFTDANNGWAVGHYKTSDNVYHTLVLHWDGSAWNLVPGYDEPGAVWNQLYSVTVNQQGGWAVGGYSMTPNPRAGEFEPPSAFQGAHTLVLQLNEGSWQKVDSPNRDAGSYLVSVTAWEDEAWAIGSSITTTGLKRTLTEYYTDAPPGTPTNTPTSVLTPTSVPTSVPTNTALPTSTPLNVDAFALLQPSGPITVTLGDRFVLDLFVNAGSNNVTAAQSYMTFTHSVMQVVNVSQQGCVLTSTALPDVTTFDAVLQNEICNGPDPCVFRGTTIGPGSIAYASGALTNCDDGCPGDFRVAQIGFCASAEGEGVIHWQFSPPDPPMRHSEIVSVNGERVANRTLYMDYVVHVTSPGMMVGHVTWQGRPAQPDPLQQMPITLTLTSGTKEIDFEALHTDANGYFTVSLEGLAEGVYSWRVKEEQYLANTGNIELTGNEPVEVEMGIMLAGDCNNDNIVNVSDFNILKNTFGLAKGEPEYDGRANFNGDSVVNASDFNLLQQNFGKP